jgi:16S rRNA processing protein RimM
MQYFTAGKLVATFGVDGYLVLQHVLGKKTSLKGLEVLFLEDKGGSFLPWFVQETKIKSDAEVYVKLEGIDSKEAARKLTPKQVWLKEDDFHKFTKKSAPVSLLGYLVVDGEKEIGVVREVMEQPHQLLCTLDYKGVEVLVPVHEASLKKMDNKNKKIFLELPEGLLDLYLDAANR